MHTKKDKEYGFMKNRTVIIGIDGVPYSLLKYFSEKDVMPNFNELRNNGVFKRMDSSIPEISSVSWSSAITGKNPGEHNIFGFTDIIPNTYTISFPNFSTLKSKPFWIKQNKEKHVVINVPQTYPVKELNGFHISGFVSLDFDKSVYPLDYIDYLNEINYRIDVDSNKAHKSIDLFLDDLFDVHEKRMKLTNKLWENYKWDNFMIVFTGSDRIEHFLMDAYKNKNHTYYDKFIEYFKRVDASIGDILKKMNEHDNLIMLSDHGMENIKTNVNVNSVLVENEILFLGDNYKKRYNNIEEKTQAFALDPGRIYLNKKNKFPKGEIYSSKEKNIIDKITDIFSNLKFNGQRVVKKIFLKEDIYHGKYLENAPDIVLLPNSGFCLRAGINDKKIFEHDDIIKGMHTQDDAFLFVKNKFNQDKIPEKPCVEDIIPIMKKIRK